MGNWVLLKGFALQLSILFLIASSSAAQQCYFPNGDPSNDVPCFPDSSASHCCSSNAICLTNKLCLSMKRPYHLSRGSCTDQNWMSESCPRDICEKAQRSSGAAIIPINGTGTDWLYCCNAVHGNGDGLVCSTTQREPQDPFEVFNSYVIPGVAALSNLVRDPEHTSSIVANGTITGTMKSNCTNDEANNVTTSSLSSSPSSSSCHDVAIGAGVGVPLGVIALLSIAWALWERMKRKSMSLQSVQPTQSASNKCRNSEPTELQTFSYEPNELDGSSRGG